MELSPEEIEKNWEQFCGFFDKLGDRAEPAKKLLEAIGTTFSTAPASGKTYYHNAFVGGLVLHSLSVFKNALTVWVRTSSAASPPKTMPLPELTNCCRGPEPT